MVLKNGIAVDFSYSEKEKKKYQEAGKALNKYKRKLVKKKETKATRSWQIKRKKSAFLSLILLLFFMSYEVVLLTKWVGMSMVESGEQIDLAYTIEDVSNTVGFVYTVILFGIIIYFTKSSSRLLGDDLWEVLKGVIKYFFKAIGVWLVIFFVIYVLACFMPKGSTLYKLIEEKFQIEETIERIDKMNDSDLLEDELEFLGNNNI